MNLKLLVVITAVLPVADGIAEGVAMFPSKQLEMRTHHKLLSWSDHLCFPILRDEYK